MDMPIVLSHRTAWLYHNVARLQTPVSSACDHSEQLVLVCADGIHDELRVPSPPPVDIGLHGKLKASCAIEVIRDHLVDLGIDRGELDRIDILHSFDFERPGAKTVCCHAFGDLIPADHLIEIARNLFVVDEAMCFAQASSWMSELEQLEYGFEICARYHLDHLHPGGFVEMPERYRAEDLVEFCELFRSHRGVRRALRIARRVRDGARSPMETALAIMVVAKRSQGGLGYCKIELNHRIDIPASFKHLTRAEYCEIDLFAPVVNGGLEYNGSDHLSRERSSRDAERLAVLTAMGYKIVILTGTQFANQLQMHRALNNVATLLGIVCDRSEEYQKLQNELRTFVIRNWNASELGETSTSRA